MKSHAPFARSAGAFALCLASLALSGCASSSEDAASQEATEDELARSFTTGVAAIELTRGPADASPRVIGQKTKVQKLMRAFRPRGRSAFCAANSETRLALFDEAGEPTGKVVLNCFRGNLTRVDGRSALVVLNPSDMQVFEEPQVVADALWGIDKIEIDTRFITKTVSEKDEIAKIVDAYGPDQSFGSDPMPGCLPSRVVTFYRAGEKVAVSNHACSTTPTGEVTGSFRMMRGASSEEGSSGTIRIDSSAVESVFVSLPSAQGGA